MQTDGNERQRRLQDLLLYPREDLHIEAKAWLDLADEGHKADLAAAILALANYGGGFILVGFEDGPGGCIPAEPRPTSLKQYSQDLINGIVKAYADPVFHCPVYHVEHPITRAVHPIIEVPDDHKVPIRSKRDGTANKHVRQNTYYTRRPGPSSEGIQSAAEWDELLERCLSARREDLLEEFRRIMRVVLPQQNEPPTDVLGWLTAPRREPSLSDEPRNRLNGWVQTSRARWVQAVKSRLGDDGLTRYQFGTWTVAYSLLGDFEHLSLSALRSVLTTVQGRESGWPPWWVPDRAPIWPSVADSAIECLIAEAPTAENAWRSPRLFDASHSDFWTASPDGNLFLLRGYQEDGADVEFEPGTRLDVSLPIWRVGECLLHAERFAKALDGSDCTVAFQFTWEGLAGRTLTAWATRDCRRSNISARRG